MARSTTQQTDSAPWLARWTAANTALESTTADTAPVELVIPPDQDFIRLSISSDVDVAAGTGAFWHLVMVDTRVLEDESEPTVVYVREFETENAPFATDRRTHFDGAGGRFLHQIAGGGELVFDIRGLGQSVGKGVKWYLVLVTDSDTMTALYLSDYWTWKRRPS